MTTVPTSLDQSSHASIEGLLVGHRVTKVSQDTLELDNGVKLRFEGNMGCGGCPSGEYELTELNDTDNIITSVEFADTTEALGEYETSTCYEIFVFADNKRLNLAQFVGDDGNGYYGTGYTIHVQAPAESWVCGFSPDIATACTPRRQTHRDLELHGCGYQI